MPELWTDRFFPKSFEEFIGNSEVLETVKKWAADWETSGKQKPLLFHGQSGAGKTCLAILSAQQFGWDLFEMNASDFRTKDVIEKIAGAASQGASFSGKKRLLLIDEVDGIQGRADSGGGSALVKILKDAQQPVIMTANELYPQGALRNTFAVLRSACIPLKFRRINYFSIAKRLRELLELEEAQFDPDAVKELAKESGGDFRAALLDTQTLALDGSISMDSIKSLGFREREEDVFKVLGKIFRSSTVAEARAVRFKSDLDSEMLSKWFEENIPIEFSDSGDIASGFDVLSRSDIFEGRIFRRQYYGLRRYSAELATTGVALSRNNEYTGWSRYQFPGLLRKLSANMAKRRLKKALAKKAGKKTHSSSRTVISEDLPFLKMLFKNKEKAVQLTAAFEFDEKEVAFLMGSKPETKKVQKTAEQASELIARQIALKRKPLAAVKESEFDAAEKPGEESAEAKKEPKKKDPHRQTRLF